MLFRSVPPDVLPAEGAVASDGKNSRHGDATVAIVPHAPLLDHAAVGITQEWKGQQKLGDHGVVVLDGVDRYPGEADPRGDEAVPGSCVRGQLPVAVWSPIPAVEDNQDWSAGQVLIEMPILVFLVGQFEVDRLVHAISLAVMLGRQVPAPQATGRGWARRGPDRQER